MEFLKVVSGQVLFTLQALFTQTLSKFISHSRRGHHKSAEDTQLHQASLPSDFHSLIADAEQRVNSVGRWMTGNRLKLNNDKTEALSLDLVEASACHMTTTFELAIIFPSTAVLKNLGVRTDSALTMVKHTDHISRSAYLGIRRIRSIGDLLTTIATALLIFSSSFVFCFFVFVFLFSLLIDINCSLCSLTSIVYGEAY